MHRHAGVTTRRLRHFIAVLSAVGLFVILTAACLATMSFDNPPGSRVGKRRRFSRSASETDTTTNNTPSDSSKKKDEYPDDLFSLEEKQKGAVILHVLGLVYMFLALATVSDEFFIPTLEVITEEFSVSADVAGATFMAAGGSAPELFTSVIGVFIANSNVGFGTIVGSAVFNVLFVIGMCVVFSKGVLLLTWWPLFRDCFFYILSLSLLIVFFLNDRQGTKSKITWWESCTLMACYLLYVLFMKYNVQLEGFAKGVICKRNRVEDDSLVLPSRASARDTDIYIQKALEYMKDNSKEGQCFRFGLLQLVLRTIDPLRDASVGDLVLEMESISHKNGRNPPSPLSPVTCLRSRPSDTMTLPNSTVSIRSSCGPSVHHSQLGTVSSLTNSSTVMADHEGEENYIQIAEHKTDTGEHSENIVELASPLEFSWPTSLKDRIVFIIRVPILFLLHVTMSDVRKPEKRPRYPWTFFVSILWIVVFSYFMVWWAREISITMEIDDETMGLTVLAAGTSIPDLITSVLVARKGYGDMAVSSSVGSNLFDVTIGLPLPWLLWSIVHSGRSFEVTSSGLFCSTIMLFFMLLAVVIAIAVCRWKMNKTLGILMLLLYIAFVVLSVLVQKDIIECLF